MTAQTVAAPAAAPPLTSRDLIAYFDTLAEAVDRIDPGPSAPGGWEARERLRLSTWVRQAYEHPLSPRVFAHPDARVARTVRDATAAALGLRLEVCGNGVRPARPTVDVRATAAVAAVWAVTAQAVAQSPRPPRERVVSDAWAVAQEIIAPAGQAYARARGSW
ncbi:hypothetical protein [Streptomyces sp. Ag109_G2-15]|uniref:hypothetical protein n=1 Tax=Streptomyces sp. Ag109_G2-15 TaxID=1938850 RepID=UPI000BD44A5E|nr:hypothetical protein [Streptomyces sp. Ag109_G2-15]SOD84009.1 hypothetical protein SAMN06272765_1382 [Streptomyces sp. Ag109_G2-15]